MSSLPGDDASIDIVQPVARSTPTTVVDGDVVLSGVVLVFVAVAFAFVLFHYLTVHRRRGQRDAAAMWGRRTPSGGRRGVRVRVDGAPAKQGVDPVALPVTLFRAKDFAFAEEEAPECAVCLGELSDGEATRFLPECGHGFHAECVDPWLRSHLTCPLCRVDVVARPDASPSPSLPPLPPEPANYPADLPTNVLFWGSQDAVTTAGTTTAGGASSSRVEMLVIEVPETTAPAAAAAAHGGDAAKPQGLARLMSLRQMWSRKKREVGARSARSCGRGGGAPHTAAAYDAVGDIAP